MKKIPSMSSIDDLAVFDSALADFVKTQSDLNDKLTSAQKRLAADFQLLDEISKRHSGQLQQHAQLGKMLDDIETNSSLETSELVSRRMSLAMLKEQLTKLKEVKPHNGSMFVRLMMGNVNVKLWKKSDLLNFRDEYNRLKNRCTWVFILFPLVQLLGFNYRIVWTLHQLWLVYYYLALSLRQNILLTNGSNIKFWWIAHHYLSIAFAVVIIAFPNELETFISERYRAMQWFALSQGLIMLAQNWYTAKRKYVRVAIGKAKPIDVDASETLVEKPTHLKMLIPPLFALYLFELYLGADALLFFYQHKDSSPQVFVLGVLSLVIAFGNAISLGQVLISKTQARRLQRLLVGHQQGAKQEEEEDSEQEAEAHQQSQANSN